MAEEIHTFPGFEKPALHFNILMAGRILTTGSRQERFERTAYPYYVFECVISGKGHLTINERTYEVEKGSLYILHKGLDHTFYPDSRDPWHKVFIIVDGKLVEAMIQTLGLANVFLVRDFAYPEILETIISTARENTEDSRIRTCGLFCELCMRIVSCSGTSTPLRYSERVTDLKSFIDEHVGERLRIRDFAKHARMSSSQVNRVFKKETGYTPYDYMLEKKMENAKLLLMNTNTLMKKIAYGLGFHDEYYFSNLFKKRVGVSPHHYRRTCRSGQGASGEPSIA